MTKTEAQKRIEKLKRLINYHRYLYHVLDRQEISESALDSLKKELFDLEERYPEFITPDSPTQRIGGKPLEKFEKVKHPTQMLSLNDAFSEEDTKDWLTRISKLLSEEDRKKLNFYCELKIDGLAIELIYKGKEKILTTGSTRGDGLIGEDVTQNLKTIEAIPLKLREMPEMLNNLEKTNLKEVAMALQRKELKEIIVRGEVFVSKKEFEKVNKEQQKQNLPPFANPRNMAAGSIRQLDPQITSKRWLDTFAYELVADLGTKTHKEKHEVLKILGFKTNPHNKFSRNLQEIFDFHKFWFKQREKLPYEIDGIVVQVNDNKIFQKLGVVGKAPRGAIAYKFPLKQATTRVKDIIVQVGRTGALTPVAILEPVKVGGVKISRATLHNEDEIKRLDVKIGDTVIVGRAGDVIPEVVKVLPDLRTGQEKTFRFPKKCPACSSTLIKQEGEVIWRCSNPNCFAKKRKYFYHFVSRATFDIVGLGPKIVDKLLDAGLISDPADLFKLEIGDIIPLESLPRRPPSFVRKEGVLRGFAEKSAKNLVKAIQEKKKISLSRLIFALGIRNVGEQTALDLVDYFGTLEKFKNASLEELQAVSDIGPVVGRSIYDWFRSSKNRKFLEKLTKIITIKEAPPPIKIQKFKGMTFVLTGRLESMTREEAKNRIRELGGKIISSVSSTVDFVVVGKDPGTKYKEAKNLGLKLISESQFKKMPSPA